MPRLTALLLASILSMCCVSTETRPDVLRDESPHIELKLSHPLVRPGQLVFARAYGRGKLNGGWVCTYQLWRSDESSWQGTGTEPKAECGEVYETWIWPSAPGRQYSFTTSGMHEVCVQVYDRKGLIIGRQQCAPVEVVSLQ